MNVIRWASSYGQVPNCQILGCNGSNWQAHEQQLLDRVFSCSLLNSWVSYQMHYDDSMTRLFAMNVILWASNYGQVPNCQILGCNGSYWQAHEQQLLNRVLSCSLINSWVSCQMHDDDSITLLFAMNVIRWASNYGQVPNCQILGCNGSYWQAHEQQLLDRDFSCSLISSWVSYQMHHDESITRLFAMNVIPWASNYGQVPNCQILGCNGSYWQAHEQQLLNRVLECSLKSAWVSCQMHDDDSITRLFAMNLIPWASNWGQVSAWWPQAYNDKNGSCSTGSCHAVF